MFQQYFSYIMAEFDDNIWIFIFLLIAEKQDFVDLNTILWKFQMTFAQILDTDIL
jgi:hypothetical protein